MLHPQRFFPMLWRRKLTVLKIKLLLWKWCLAGGS
jgi:hypothetical protein